MKNRPEIILAFLFLFFRLILLISMSMDGLRGFGDLSHFFQIASMGVPFLDLWVEFPPIFPFFSWLIYQASGGLEHIYDYLMVITLSLAQAATLVIFFRVAGRISGQIAWRSTLVYLAILLVLPYGWWYFDAIAVLFTLMGLLQLLENRPFQAGAVIAAGILTKLFPALLLPLVWRIRTSKDAVKITVTCLGVAGLAIAVLLWVSPQMTRASLTAQASKGSWETMWALVDGNFATGNFGPEIERYNPEYASVQRKNPAIIPPWLSLAIFGVTGGILFLRAKISNDRGAIAFLGVTWCIFSIWSPGYSPQWVLYLIPLILLVLPERQAILFVLIFVLVNILEWPVMLSRGYNWGLWVTIPVRTLLWIFLTGIFWSYVNAKVDISSSVEEDWIIAG